jgi:hypothetical protein
MNIWAAYEVNEFIVAFASRGRTLKDYFLTFYLVNNGISVDLGSRETPMHEGNHSKTNCASWIWGCRSKQVEVSTGCKAGT